MRHPCLSRRDCSGATTPFSGAGRSSATQWRRLRCATILALRSCVQYGKTAFAAMGDVEALLQPADEPLHELSVSTLRRARLREKQRELRGSDAYEEHARRSAVLGALPAILDVLCAFVSHSHRRAVSVESLVAHVEAVLPRRLSKGAVASPCARRDAHGADVVRSALAHLVQHYPHCLAEARSEDVALFRLCPALDAWQRAKLTVLEELERERERGAAFV